MNDSHDQSYYEIALTNRQVLSIFVVLLVCVLASFLGGVWLARDAEPRVEVASTQAILAGEAADAPLQPLDFFDRPAATGKAGASENEGSKASEAVDAVPAAQRRPSEARAKSAQSPKPPDAKPASRAPVESSSGPRPQPEAKPPAGERSSIPPAASPDPVPSSVVIQVFSSNEEAQALRVADRLRKSGYPAILSPVEVAGRTLHRVRIGPYSDSDEAQVVAESVRRAFKFDTWITH